MILSCRWAITAMTECWVGSGVDGILANSPDVPGIRISIWAPSSRWEGFSGLHDNKLLWFEHLIHCMYVLQLHTLRKSICLHKIKWATPQSKTEHLSSLCSSQKPSPCVAFLQLEHDPRQQNDLFTHSRFLCPWLSYIHCFMTKGKPGMVVHDNNPGSWETDAGRLWSWVHFVIPKTLSQKQNKQNNYNDNNNKISW